MAVVERELNGGECAYWAWIPITVLLDQVVQSTTYSEGHLEALDL